jgi:hypothetical protein
MLFPYKVVFNEVTKKGYSKKTEKPLISPDGNGILILFFQKENKIKWTAGKWNANKNNGFRF